MLNVFKAGVDSLWKSAQTLFLFPHKLPPKTKEEVERDIYNQTNKAMEEAWEMVGKAFEKVLGPFQEAHPLYEYEPDYAVKPSDVLFDFLEERGITKEEFKDRVGITGEQLDDFIDGKIKIDEKLAKSISEIIGCPVFWLNLQRLYDERSKKLAKLKVSE